MSLESIDARPGPAVSTDPQVLAPSGVLDALAALAGHIRTASIYDELPPRTFSLLVTRDDPRTFRRQRRGKRSKLAPIHAHWPLFAPSELLLTGHETACLARRCHGAGSHAGHVATHLGWPTLAAAYRAELEDWPFYTRLAVARQVTAWLRDHETVTILSFERRVPDDALIGWWAQRHVFRDWLRSLLPLALPLGDALALTKGGGAPLH